MDLVHNLANDLPHNRHDDLLNANLARNLEMRSLNDLELQASLTQTLVQNINEQELARNMSIEMNRINDVIPQNISRSEQIPHDLGHEIDLSHHLNRQNIEQDVLMSQDGRRTPLIQSVQDGHILEQNLVQRLEQNLNQRLDQTLGHRIEHKMELNVHESNQRHEQEHLLPMPFHIKSEQEDDGYFYESINHGINNAINGKFFFL